MLDKKCSGTDAVSVIMGVYNAADTLPEALESLARQEDCIWELVACDDASTDATLEILRTFESRYPDKVVILRNDANRGLAFSLNRCLRKSACPYIARMDADDINEPNRLGAQSRYLRENPHVDLVGSAVTRFDQEGVIDVSRPKERPEALDLRKGVTFAHPTVMIRRSVLESLNGYRVSELTRRCEDLELWFRFFEAGYVGHNLSVPLYRFREDREAVRRRTAKSRWRRFIVAVKGHKRLGFPLWTYVHPMQDLAKALIPHSVLRWNVTRRRMQERGV